MEIGANNINNTELVSSNYNSKNTSKYHLSIEIGLGIFSYAIIDTNEKKCKTIESYKIDSIDINKNIEHISNIYNNSNILKNSFKSTSIGFAYLPNTLIPSNHFSKKEDNNLMLEFNHELQDTTIIEDNLNIIEAHNIYAIPTLILDMLNTFFPGFQIKSNSSILIEYLAKYHTSQNDKKLFLSVGKNYIEIIIFKGKDLLLQNIFKYHNKEDVLYYVLFCMQELGLSTEKDPIILLDNIRKNDDVFSILYDYIRNISFIKRPIEISMPKELNKVEQHQYTSLLYRMLCA